MRAVWKDGRAHIWVNSQQHELSESQLLMLLHDLTDITWKHFDLKRRNGDGAMDLNLWSTSGLRAQLIDLGRSPPSPVGDARALAIRAELRRREGPPDDAA
jgi:hypothetical protein